MVLPWCSVFMSSAQAFPSSMGCDINGFVAFFWPRQGEQTSDGSLRDLHPELVQRISEYLPENFWRHDVASLRTTSSEFAEMVPKERLYERRQRPKATVSRSGIMRIKPIAPKSRKVTAVNAFGGQYIYRSNHSGWTEYWESMWRDCCCSSL